MLLVALGVTAGLITTVSGFGGGMVLVSALALLWDPLTALTVSSLALLVGNAQRLYMFRRGIRPRVAAPLVLGAVPGSLVGALVAGSLPPLVLQASILGVTGLALWRAISGTTWAFPIRALGPAAAAIGALAAMSGGGGFLLGPLLLSAGIMGDTYIATGAVTAVFIHTGRLAGYGANGMIHADTFLVAAGIAASIVAGNVLGRWVRGRLSDRSMRGVEYAAPIACALLALAGTVL